MARRTLLEHLDSASGGTLGDKLRAFRAEPASYAEIAHRLRAEGIHTTAETVRQWFVNIENESAA